MITNLCIHPCCLEDFQLASFIMKLFNAFLILIASLTSNQIEEQSFLLLKLKLNEKNKRFLIK